MIVVIYICRSVFVRMNVLGMSSEDSEYPISLLLNQGLHSDVSADETHMW